MEPTKEQMDIINYNGHTIVIAQPGSGKTYTLVSKIISVLKEMKEYQGVIAISYTRKASKELEERCLHGGIEKKGSFFGTMDKFYITEIILPFGRHVFGRPKKEIEIIEGNDSVLRNYILEEDRIFIEQNSLAEWANSNIIILRQLFLNGFLLLETVSFLSLYLLNNSKACIDYLKSRYKYIIIDEYQDCSAEQNEIFIKLKNIGLTAIAVGDVNQSIFEFTNKSSKFLLQLAQDDSFKIFQLSKNHRCHPSIINYSMKFISKNFTNFINTNDNRVFSIAIEGCEANIAVWLNKKIELAMSKYGVTKFNEVAILVRNKRTGKIIDESLALEHKFFDGTPFDNDSSLWGLVFADILRFIFDDNVTKYMLTESYINMELQKTKARRIISILSDLKKLDRTNSNTIKINFLEIAKLIFPSAYNQNAINILEAVLKDDNLLENFKPAKDNQVQIMTLHKSKGLEFDIVFHLDLYEYIFPKKVMNEQGEFYYPEPVQDMNLHYVGITRAKKCCVLCTSTQRTNAKNELKKGSNSEFLRLPRLQNLRKPFLI